jgi:hypothetical protein
MIRIERMTLRLPPDTGDPRIAAGEAVQRIAGALVGVMGQLDRLSVEVGPGEDVAAATARAIDAELTGRS